VRLTVFHASTFEANAIPKSIAIILERLPLMSFSSPKVLYNPETRSSGKFTATSVYYMGTYANSNFKPSGSVK
jgi:hypothetical protein